MNLFFWLKKRTKSGSIAKKRLKSILISDRTECSTNFIDTIKGEIGQTLSKYMEVDTNHMSMEFVTDTQTFEAADTKLLFIKIPFREINKVIY